MNEISPQFFFVTQIADVLQKKNPSVILTLVSNIGAGWSTKEPKMFFYFIKCVTAPNTRAMLRIRLDQILF